MLGLSRGLCAAFAAAMLAPAARADDIQQPFGFEVVTKDLTQCGNTQIQWQNGVPPLYLTVIVGATPCLPR